MPIVTISGRSQFQHWWNWSARDPKTGKLKTFFTNGFTSVVSRDQLLRHLKGAYPYLDFTDFSCELTDRMPPNKRDVVPADYRMDEWQRWANRRLTGEKHDAGAFAKPGLIVPRIITPKRIL